MGVQVSDKELDRSVAEAWARCTLCGVQATKSAKTAARYILDCLSAGNRQCSADPPQSVVTLTLAGYEALKAWAEGMFAKATLAAWSDVNEYTQRVVDVLLEVFHSKQNVIPDDVISKIGSLIDQWDRRRERLTEDAG